MLDRLREINVGRHDIAEREFLHQKRIVDQLHVQLKEQQELYNEYVASIPRLEDEAFREIFNKPVPDKDISSYKIALRKIEEHAEKLKDDITATEKKLEQEEEVLEEKRKNLQIYQKKIKKFDNLIEKQIKEEKFIAEIKEDNEIEESFRPPRSLE